jgi:hypothetical protein
LPGIVQEVGAVAALAAVVGQALLLGLYVSQAREVKRLREWAGGAPEQTVVTAPRRARSGIRSVAVVLGGLLVLAGAAFQLTRDGGGDEQPVKPKRSRATVHPGNVTVSVLNGTTVPGLAAALRERIAAAGFKKGTIDTFSDQQLAKSVVQYASGHQAEAKAVGRRLGISRREPVTAESRAVAGDATVIVIAGADKAR